MKRKHVQVLRRLLYSIQLSKSQVILYLHDGIVKTVQSHYYGQYYVQVVNHFLSPNSRVLRLVPLAPLTKFTTNNITMLQHTE